jgi:uroporphyrinogen decarboxylase
VPSIPYYSIDYLCSREADHHIRQYLGVETEEALLEELGVDYYYLSGRDISQNETCSPYYRGPALEKTAQVRKCPLGIQWQRCPSGCGKFDVEEAIGSPFDSETTVQDILDYRWPVAEDFDFSGMREEAEHYRNRLRIGGLWSGIFGDSYRMIGFSQFLMDMMVRPDVIHALVDRMTEMYLELNEHLFTQLEGELDIWFFGNDFGTQQGLLFGPELWDRFFAENVARLTDLAHRFGMKVMMHSCGSIRPLLDRLIEAGVDILDPVQSTAVDMEIPSLSEQFSGRIVFHGGIDTQHTLRTASPEEAAQHAESVITAFLDKGCKYILAPTQIYQTDLPVENIVAVYEVAKKFKNR